MIDWHGSAPDGYDPIEPVRFVPDINLVLLDHNGENSTALPSEADPGAELPALLPE